MLAGRMLVVLCVVLLVAGPCWTGGAEDTSSEIAVLKEQLKEQAAIIEALQSRLEEVEAKQAEQVAAPPAPPGAASVEADTRTTPAVRAKYPIDLYGYIKLDTSYDTDGANNGNYLRWVDPPGVGRDDDQFNATARQTRLGLNILGPEMGGAKTAGKVEIDFYGGGGENTPQPRIRHAYFTMEWPERDVQLLFGQTWDVMSPLTPRNLNFTNLWWTGNAGYRRPQARVTKGFAVGEAGRIELALAATRNIGDADLFAFGEDTGSDAGFPGVQGRAAFTFRGVNGLPATIGLSGHYGEEEHDYTTLLGGRGDQDVKSWSAHFEAKIPFTKKFLLEGEAFTGANMDAYVAGIGQGVVVVPFQDGRFRYARAIRTRGGWVNAEMGPFGKWRFTVGGGLENVDDKDILFGQRSRNIGIFANAIYAVRENVDLGLEVLHWQTDYKHLDDRENLRLQGSAIFKF